jgi:hypothetical protein
VPAENSEQPKQQRKLPERADALRVELPFEEAVRAALAVEPEPRQPKKRRKTAS